VISSIVHLVHKYANDSEPWPIQIEDHDGRLHEVNLQEGQVRGAGTRGTVPTLMMRDMHYTCTSVLCHRLYAYVLGRCLALLQMLFYESAKCLHGRMKAFRGDYYGSIFLHYRPVDRGLWSYDVEVRMWQQF
jgi:hypothetical protein